MSLITTLCFDCIFNQIFFFLKVSISPRLLPFILIPFLVALPLLLIAFIYEAITQNRENSKKIVDVSKEIIFSSYEVLNSRMLNENEKKIESVEDVDEISNEESHHSTKNNQEVFISYSWDNEEHTLWIKMLAKRLINSGFTVIFDNQLKSGENLEVFMEESIIKSDKIIVVFTPNYLKKAMLKKGGVGYEYSLITAKLKNDLLENSKVIPILKKGDIDSSIPVIFQQYLFTDFRNKDNFELKYLMLLNALERNVTNKP